MSYKKFAVAYMEEYSDELQIEFVSAENEVEAIKASKALDGLTLDDYTDLQSLIEEAGYCGVVVACKELEC